MLHLHFGAGRLGLGLAAPFFKKEQSDLFLFNRLNSSPNPTGDAGLAPARKTQLLKNHPNHMYVIQTPGREKVLEKIGYTSFNSYDERTIEQTIASVAEGSAVSQKGVVVTASIVDPSNYTSVITALNLLSQMRADGANTGRIER